MEERHFTASDAAQRDYFDVEYLAPNSCGAHSMHGGLWLVSWISLTIAHHFHGGHVQYASISNDHPNRAPMVTLMASTRVRAGEDAHGSLALHEHSLVGESHLGVAGIFERLAGVKLVCDNPPCVT